MNKFFLIFLFSFLIGISPIFYSDFFSNIGFNIPIQIEGNYEFTKNIFIISLVILIFFIKKIEKINSYVFYITIFLILSSLLSTSTFYSFFGYYESGYGFIFFLALLLLYTIIQNTKKEEKKDIENVIIVGNIIFSIIYLYIYFKNNINYGTLGQHNYVALYELLTIPLYLAYLKEKKWYYFLGFILSIFCLLLSQSFIGISIFLIYLIYKGKKNNIKKTFLFGSTLLITIIGICFFYFPEKLHSLVSRYYIWETTLKIIFSDIKIFFFGSGLETLPYFFSNYKSPYLYIFENYGYTATSSHNFLLDIFFYFGFFAFIGMIYFLNKVIKDKAKNYIKDTIFIFIFFSFFNPVNSIGYILITVFLGFYFYKNKKYYIISKKVKLVLFLPLVMIFFSMGKYYIAENYAFQNRFTDAINLFPTPYYYYKIGDFEKGKRLEGYESKEYFISKLNESKNIENDCRQYTHFYYSAEDYIFCGKLLESRGNKKIAYNYYKIGINKIPDLWNKDSVYYNNLLINRTISGNRFFSEKYSPLEEILNKLYPEGF